MNGKTTKLNSEEVKGHAEKEGEEMDVETVTIATEELEDLQDLLTQTGQENEQLKSDIKVWIVFKDNMVEKFTKSEFRKEKIRT